MKPIKLLCVISKIKPQIELRNLVIPKDKKDIRLMKGEKIEETITMSMKDYIALIGKR